ncbi:MAG: aspartyl-tRNA(Asn)/glutamyl-tRNA(Gln) amidotransferase subunit C [Desulfobacteraceae bacterium Eth-SRB1]|nr:MAG: aspartyl-tRNA(Asn)/glutamyl-tRNA(Gln) amidotransferase subunit C [Desulfobacteraceae bacterium Eth-SRB1]
MKITKDEVIHVANLARLDLDEDSIDLLAGQIGKILEYVDTLNRVDTEGVPSTSYAIFLNNAFREDSVKESLDRDKALANAPEKEDGNFVVPKVINS